MKRPRLPKRQEPPTWETWTWETKVPVSEDFFLLVSELDRLKKENEDLVKEKDELDKDWRASYHQRTSDVFIEKFGFACFATFVLGLASLLIFFPSYKAITTPNKVDYCYIVRNQDGVPYALNGNVEWHQDIRYGEVKNIQEAKELAKQNECILDLTQSYQ